MIGYRGFYAVSAIFRPYNGGDPIEWVLGISVLSQAATKQVLRIGQKGPCHNRYGTIKIPLWSIAISADHGSKFAALRWQWERPYDHIFLEPREEQYTLNNAFSVCK